MAFEHPSALPNCYDRALSQVSWQGVVHYGANSYVQAAELNEAQRIIRNRAARVGRIYANDGDRIEHGAAIVDIEAETVIIEAGKVYAAGDLWSVPEAILTDVPMSGRVEVGIRLVTSYITHEDDATLLGLVAGSDSEGEPGAAREVGTVTWAWEGDDGDGTFFTSYILQDGTILDQVGPNILAPALQAIGEYDKPNGNYVVKGNRVTALGANAGAQIFSISEGEANINGSKRTRLAALRHSEPEDWDELAIPGETHTYPGGASYTFTVAQGPIGVINSILLTKEKTVTVTRGAIANGADGLPDTSVIELVEVKQGATTYVAGTAFNRVNNTVDWSPAGPEPTAGSTYTVKYRYRASVAADAFTDYTITVSGGATGGDIIAAYTSKLQRIDLLCLAEDGSPVYIKGISALSNPRAPIVPSNVLKLARIENAWVGTPSVVNDATYFHSQDEIQRVIDRLVDLDRLLQLERLKSGIDAREPVAKLNTFVDPFIDDTYRDQGVAQSGSIVDGMLTLSIEPTFFVADLTAPVMLDYTEEVLISQPLKTFCEKINPYANFTLLPGSLKLSPAVDFWTVSANQWLSSVTQEFNRGTTTANGPLQASSSETRIEDRRVEQLQFLRQISLAFTISGFGPGEILSELTFDGVNVKPAGVQAANGAGVISGSFTIPANVTAGTKAVFAKGMGGTEATSLFVGQGTIEINVMRQVTTIDTWTRARTTAARESSRDRSSDPQAQLFAVSETRQILGIDFHLCAIGDTAKDIVVNQVTTDNGYPTSDIVAEGFVSMIGATVGWKAARYSLPITTSPETRHAHVIKTDDNNHSISFAKLSGFDADLQRYVTSHPYVVGPRFSSVNAETWSAHQDEAMVWRTIAAEYPVTTKTVALGSFDLVDCSDLQVRASVELPSAGCSVEFEIERTNGTIYRLAPYQVLQLTEYITETVELRAVLKGTSKLSPILFAPVELIAGEIAQELVYVTRAFKLGTAVRIANWLKAYLPGGSTLAVAISKDGGAWTNMPLEENEALAYPLWTERKYELSGQTADLVRLKVTGTGGPASRLVVGDFGASVM
ncbi:DUF4815 domain-containing protein [Rhizobium sp. CECT 9324]|uniref:DUF4815 domain-containing protein n=1 Tax=Rhizobium sp. CECT 9324 TaxID=2845820 RepID=UPI001E3EBFD8|nr:DUF4815 domain-containing protein [Rhizobium sp. CECT 9324]CAH0339569.1 hypothetical protein RHI9324_01220 [Rhizobium sp. CECT 9324]